MKFLHCADLHLDSPLRGLARYEGAPVEMLRGATRRALEAAVDVAVDHKVAAVVMAGDLYDGNRDDFQTAVFLQRQLHRLDAAKVDVVIAYGNHDAESEITRRLQLPANTTVLPTGTPDTVVLHKAGLAFHGQSYPTKAVTADLSAAYPQAVPRVLNVGVLHTSLDGRPGHAPYAPCTLEGLAHHGYAYWALGHVHRREVHLVDGVYVVFPGNICGRDVGETGAKGATLVEYHGDEVTAVTEVPLAPVRWHRVTVDATRATTIDEATSMVVARMGSVRETGPGLLHAVRVHLQLSRGLYGHWTRRAEECELQLRVDAAGGDGDLWVERIEVRPTASAPIPIGGEALTAVIECARELRDGERGGQLVDQVLAGVRSCLRGDLEEVVVHGAPGLDSGSHGELLAAAEALLIAELEHGA